jgi:hypothetical protein
MSKAALKTRVKRLAEALKPTGFVQDGPLLLKRASPFLIQFIEFQSGHGGLRGKFTCNVAWTFALDDQPTNDHFDYSIRIGHFIGNRDIWFSFENSEELERAIESLRCVLTNEVMPFLDSVFDLRRMVDMYEAVSPSNEIPHNPKSPLFYFGMDSGWRNYNLGFTCKVLGDSEKARNHLQVVIEQPNEPFEWVQLRKSRCLNALSQ